MFCRRKHPTPGKLIQRTKSTAAQGAAASGVEAREPDHVTRLSAVETYIQRHVKHALEKNPQVNFRCLISYHVSELSCVFTLQEQAGTETRQGICVNI